jgi:hypothetical protein
MIIYRAKEIRPGVWQNQYKVGLLGFWHFVIAEVGKAAKKGREISRVARTEGNYPEARMRSRSWFSTTA